MSQADWIADLYRNRHMRNSTEVAAFEQALAALAASPDDANLRDLALVLDDDCNQPEVMWGLVHFLESFPIGPQLTALTNVLPQLVQQAPEWTRILHIRVLNDDAARAVYADLFPKLPLATQAMIRQSLTAIAAKDPKFETKVASVMG